MQAKDVTARCERRKRQRTGALQDASRQPARGNLRRFWSAAVLCRFLALVATNVFAAHGIIETADGKKLEGDIRLDADAFVISDAAATNRIAPAFLTHLKFQPAAETNTASITGNVHGVRGTYFSQENLEGKSIVRLDPIIDFDWGLGSPAAFIGADHFSVRWEAQLEAPATGEFTFTTKADEGVRLYLDNQLLIDKWDGRSSPESSGSANLEAGKRYDLKLEYHDSELNAFVHLYWSGPLIARALVQIQICSRRK